MSTERCTDYPYSYPYPYSLLSSNAETAPVGTAFTVGNYHVSQMTVVFSTLIIAVLVLTLWKLLTRDRRYHVDQS